MKFFATFLAAATVVSGLVIERQALFPPSDQVWIEDVKWAGSGCPVGSVARTLSNDKQTVTLMFDNYVASVGPGIVITESYKNCQINIKLHIPQGWTYTVFQTQYRGYYSLESGVKGTQKSIYYFSGDTRQWSAQSTFVGPASQDYHFWDNIATDTWVYCQCGATTSLNINTSLRMQSANPKKYSGFMSTDSIDHKVIHVLGLQWKRC